MSATRPVDRYGPAIGGLPVTHGRLCEPAMENPHRGDGAAAAMTPPAGPRRDCLRSGAAP